MNLGQVLVIALSVVLALGYFWGMLINRKRGIATYYWLREGLLAAVGEVSEARWIGSAASGARLTVGEARPPFRRMEVVFLLEAREILPWWLFQRLRGRRDQMILKASLRSLPLAFDAAPAGSATLRQMQAEGNPRPVEGPHGLVFLLRGKTREADLSPWRAFLEQYGDAVISLSVSRRQPHVVARFSLPPLQAKGEPAKAFFEALARACGDAQAQG